MGRYDNRINLDEIDNVENKSLKMQIGEWYDSEDNIHTDKTRKAYETIARINNIWFELIPIPVIFQEEDPYSNYTELKETVEQEGVLRIFNGGSTPTYVSKEDNLRGRAVHDWFGHLQADCDFSFEGEWTKFNHVKTRYPEWVRPLLFTEVVGQRCAVSYYDGGFSDPDFNQKSIFAPRSIMNKTRENFK